MEGEGTAHNCIGSSESVTKQCLDNEEGDVRRKWDVGNRKTKHGLWVSLSLSLSLTGGTITSQKGGLHLHQICSRKVFTLLSVSSKTNPFR